MYYASDVPVNEPCVVSCTQYREFIIEFPLGTCMEHNVNLSCTASTIVNINFKYMLHNTRQDNTRLWDKYTKYTEDKMQCACTWSHSSGTVQKVRLQVREH